MTAEESGEIPQSAETRKKVRERVAALKKDPPKPAAWDRFDKFTARAKKVLTLSQTEATLLNHNYIGTEHLLLGLVAEGEGIAAKVLENLNVGLEQVRSSVTFIIGRGDRTVIGDISLTPRAKKVVELSIDEARQLNHNYVGTEHILLGLIREGEGIAAGVLESLGVEMELARAKALELIARHANQPGGPDPAWRASGSVVEASSLGPFAGSKDSVITCRIASDDLEALDALIEAGIRSTRSDAAAWLIHAGIQANLDLFDKVYTTVAEIKRLREQAQSAVKELDNRPPKPPPGKPTAPPPA